ncbi:hypothetical protein HDU96_004986 [Phlyctochytrium bullatum]|nr:hypothetical protein HDU96_004986 [Phlyctochytrium bullatum]
MLPLGSRHEQQHIRSQLDHPHVPGRCIMRESSTAPGARPPPEKKESQRSDEHDDLTQRQIDEFLENLVLPQGKSSYPELLVEPARLRLKYSMAYNISRCGDKAVLLACPHPGSIQYCQDMVYGVSDELDASMISLDFLSVLELLDIIAAGNSNRRPQVSPFKTTGRLRGRTASKSPDAFGPLILSHGFSPAGHEAISKEARAPEGDFESLDDGERYEDEEDEDDADSKSQSPKNINLRLVISPNVLTGNNAKNSGYLADSTNNVSFELDEDDDSAPTLTHNFKNVVILPNMYRTEIKKSELMAVVDALTKFLSEKAQKSIDNGGSGRIVIHFKDVTDTVESGRSSRMVFQSVLKVAEKLRTEKSIPALFVASCTPGLHLIPFIRTKNDVEFYREMLANPFLSSTPYEHVFPLTHPSKKKVSNSVLYRKQMYKTCFDEMKDLFDKVEIPPPLVSFVATSDAPEAKAALENAYTNWLVARGDELRKRYRELNWRCILRICREKNVVVRGIELEDVTQLTNANRLRISESFENLLSELETHIFPTRDLVKIVSMAIGYKFGQFSFKFGEPGFGSMANVELSAQHFEMALQLYRESSIENILNKDWGVSPETKQDEDEFSSSEQSDINGDSATATASPESESGSTSSQPDQINANDAANSLRKQLHKSGHRLSTYEMRLLHSVVAPENIKIGFNDIILPPPTKLMLQTIVTLPILRPEMFEVGVLSRHSVTGVLLFGPPGTGKTMLAKAVAKSCGARFMSIAPSDVFDKYVGEGEKNVKGVFSLARKLSPCVVFLDEIDAIFSSRRSDINNSRREIVNEFMSEWDGLNSKNNGVILMGATNRPFDLDDAILRRMPRRVLIDLPTEEQRKAILSAHLSGETLDPSVSLDDLAKKTEQYSGSDLKNIAIAAALAAVKETLIRETMTTTDPAKASLSTEEVLKTADTIENWNEFLGVKQSPELTKETPISKKETASKNSSERTADKRSPAASPPPSDVKRTLNMAHFEAALREIAPSLNDRTQSLIELRKWNDQYGEGSAKARAAAKKGWGFGAEA